MKEVFTVNDGGMTLRQWVKHHFSHITYDHLQQSLRKGDIQLSRSGKKLQIDPTCLLQIGDMVKIWTHLMTSTELEPEQLNPKFWEDIPVIEQNEEFWVIDKPYGMPTQGGTNIKVSMVDIMTSWMESKPYIVHRLDRKTTGIFVVATNSYAARDLGYSITDGVWKKVYSALVPGRIMPKFGVMEYPVDGKEAKTEYRVVRHIPRVEFDEVLKSKVDIPDDYVSLLSLNPITGRKHQLRQHCARFLAPIIGDELYFSDIRSRMYLRCVGLEFNFRDQKFVYEVPERFQV